MEEIHVHIIPRIEGSRSLTDEEILNYTRANVKDLIEGTVNMMYVVRHHPIH